MSRPRTGSLGCLGCFSILALGFWTALLVPLLFWLNPAWFDRVAFWRGRAYDVDDLSPPGEIAYPPAKVVDDRYRLLDAARASVPYDPARGATLEAPDGARVEMPPGSIRERLDVALTPAVQLPKAMHHAVCGPAYELRIGANEHYTFASPVKVTLPYIPELLMEGKTPAVCVWEGDRWAPQKSSFDPKTKTVTGELPHASPVAVLNAPLNPVVAGGIIAIAAAGGIGYVYSSTERGMIWASTTFRSSKKYVTHSFAIHYFTSGEHAVTADAAYPMANGRASGEHPLYVLDVGRILEDARGGLPQVGMEVKIPYVRHDVFLHFDKAFGSSPPGGPIFVHPRMNEVAAAEGIPFETAFKGTIVHELVHVAQDAYFGGLPQRFRDRWWIEASAEYLAERWWDHSGVKIDLAETFYLKGEPRLMEKPLETTGDPEYYAWAVFLHWLDRREPESGFTFVKAVNASKDATIPSLDAAAKATLGAGISDILERFARDFYHDDLWRGSTMPLLHRDAPRNQALAQHIMDKDRTFVLTKVGAEENDYAIAHTHVVKHLTAHAAITQIDGLDPALKGKLVVAVEGDGNSVVRAQIAASKLVTNGKLPSSGAPGAFEPFALGPGKSTRIIEGLGKDVNRVTLLFYNPSLSQDVGSYRVERWLLVPPASVESAREAPNQPRWKVKWEKAGLQYCPQVFKGYSVYRRKMGEPDSAYVAVQQGVQENWWVDAAPDNEDYVYTVKVKDALGNESEPAPIGGDDPFQGDWEGEVALVKGEFAKPLVAALRKIQEEDKQKELAAIAREPDAAKRASRLSVLETDQKNAAEIIALIEKFVTMAEDLARLGVPAKLKIQRVDGQYLLSVPELLWQNTGSTDTLKMKRLGPHTLGFTQQTKELPPLYLRLHRKDEIREREWLVKTPPDKDGKVWEFAFRWTFTRKR